MLEALETDGERLFLESDIDMATARDLLVFFTLQEKAKFEKIYPETIAAQKLTITVRMSRAFDENDIAYTVYPNKDFGIEHGGEWGYKLEEAYSTVGEIIAWAKKVGIPVPKEYQTNSNHPEPSPEITGEMPEAITEETPEAEVSSRDIDWQSLNVVNIQDTALTSYGEGIYLQARFYAALYAGLLMGRQGGSIRKEDLEKALKKMGFIDEKKLKDKDFQALWKAIPKSLKFQGKPSNN